MQKSEIGKCRSCPAKVMWARHAIKGSMNPLDVQANPVKGNLLIARNDKGELQYEVLTGEDLQRARSEQRPLYTSHFATCPNSRAHRHAKNTEPELLCSAATQIAAEELARAIRTTFYRHTYVEKRSTASPPFLVLTDEDLSPDVRKKVKEFIAEYVKQNVPAAFAPSAM